jgi:RHH-type transcriptional regulator, rel operon repressor / antitoxin RelB
MVPQWLGERWSKERQSAIHVLHRSLTMLALRLPKDIEDRLEALAKATGRTKSYYAREAIIEHLEDFEDAQIAVERLREDDGVRIPLSEIIRELDDEEAAKKSKRAAAA